MQELSEKSRTKNIHLNLRIKEMLGIIAGLIFIIIIFTIFTNGAFITLENLKLVTIHAIVPSMIALAMSFVFKTGIIDLSIGAILILSANLAGILALRFGYIAMFASGILCAMLLIYININLIQMLKIPSWILGLGMAMIYEAIGMYYSERMINAGKRFVNLGNQFVEAGELPYILIIFIVCLILIYFLYNKTTIGINIHAVGGNSFVAKIMGINQKRTVILGGLISGFFIGIASVVSISYSGSIIPTSSLSSISLIFRPLAIILLAAAFEKIVNLIIGIFISGMFIAGLFNFMTRIGVPSGTGQDIMLVACIVFFGILSQRNNRGIVK